MEYARDYVDAAQTAICNVFSHTNKVTAPTGKSVLEDW
jgi:hypothetical protein